MKHYILAKFKEGIDKDPLIAPITALFAGVKEIPGVHDVKVKANCIDRSNRYDIMIVIDMEEAALEAYDGCEPHKKWKQLYGDMLLAKAIFDSAY